MVNEIPPNTITFCLKSTPEPIMTLDSTGMTYMGAKITDAGEAYNAWLAVMEKMRIANSGLESAAKLDGVSVEEI